jgi:hypothetical protein
MTGLSAGMSTARTLALPHYVRNGSKALFDAGSWMRTCEAQLGLG